MDIINHILADTNLEINKVNKTLDIPATLINWVGGIAGALAVIYIMAGGILYLTAGGNGDQAKKGGQTIVNAFLGLIVIAISYGLAAWIIGILNS
ncbi:hypothetical protein COT78_00100 [Candidatus Berkelbacteria bacterium CG10_big_fil_rev_8_21_14_0_10_43_13]|uniref:Uncharacterized protein n=1 Tax=Candidatus Berkelbacteria bacterium CG10_big_fil_rev_8_21_14_0_10_43_13 TaxID=1974514 RepID=A0A2H0W7M7_9BACT|nr:MAG: hypothetical protein COT78_00100 [Candidatus Berkelbacteria bacterium CG10_big_fil_rev_8_21_14_0_10_43_13]